jgi:hypothetical protein
LAGMEELFRSTKVEALPIGLWPKLFSVTSNAEPGFKPSAETAAVTTGVGAYGVLLPSSSHMQGGAAAAANVREARGARGGGGWPYMYASGVAVEDSI